MQSEASANRLTAPTLDIVFITMSHNLFKIDNFSYPLKDVPGGMSDFLP